MIKTRNLHIYLFSLLFTLVLGLVFFYLNHALDEAIWSGMQISKSALTAEYCELNRTDHLFHQPVNTYSNLFYFFLGSIVVGLSIKSTSPSNRNSLLQFPALMAFCGLSLIYLCFGSSFFHASMTWSGQRVDMNATYAVCLSCLAISLYYYKIQAFSTGLKTSYIIFLFLLVLFFVYLHLLISSLVLLPTLIILILFFTVINYNRNKSALNIQYAFLSLFFVVGAFILRTLDVMKIVCNPTSVFQGHALWHIFTGLSAFFLFWFYYSEKISVQDKN
ncbi:MAG TPA: ceramidase domain-containing protein [Chitinophagales bacterium]|nr:ceramidase domain-containing protein [Chitinophagales bacterium]